MAKLIKLNVENFKRIQAVEIEPEGNVTIVGGLNEQGKSSLLDSISVLLQGKATKIPEPVRKGAKKAKITGEIQKDEWDAFENMVITRTITAAGNWYVKVQDKDGKMYRSPEGMLREIFGEPVDPVEFVRMTPVERVETLKRITGLDFSEMDAKRKELYDERTLVGREVKQIESGLVNFEVYPDAPNEKVLVTALLDELQKRQAVNKVNNDKKEELKNINADILTGEKVILDGEKEIKRLQEKLQKSKDLLDVYVLKKSALEDGINNFTEADEQEIKDQISTAEETNLQIDANIKFEEKNKRLEQKETERQALTQKIDDIDQSKQAQLSKINFPVDGLSFNENDVLYRDLPFNEKQLSSEELLRVSFAIAIAARPNLKNILIREGSLLDKNNLKLIGKMAKDAGIHCFIEVVGDDATKATLIIENGAVKESEINEDEFADI